MKDISENLDSKGGWSLTSKKDANFCLIFTFEAFPNKTGLQPVSRPVEQAHYFGGWVEGVKSLWCQGFADRQPYRTGGGSRCIKVGTKVCKTQQTDKQTDR